MPERQDAIDTWKAAIDSQAQDVRTLEAKRLELREAIKSAKQAGATVQQLMDWTGYSRRMIFYMLSEEQKGNKR